MKRALIFDLDETLMVEEAAAVAAFRSTAERAAADHELDAGLLALRARAAARALWHAAPTHPYCRRVGISSWEGLWCRYEGEHPEVRRLREWAPRYRRATWSRALAEQGVQDDALAGALGEHFARERRRLHHVFPDAPDALRALAGAGHRLGLLTNGASCLQREKLAASGLADRFDAVVVSADPAVGVAKPDPRPFRAALAALGATTATMIGDSLEKDIAGARGAGLDAVWVNRNGRDRPAGLGVPAVTSLAELPDLLGGAAG